MSLLWRRNGNTDFYPHSLGAILRDGQRQWDPSYATSIDPEAWEKAMINAVVSGAIDRNLTAIAGTEWELEPRGDTDADKQLADILTDLLDRIAKFTQARKDLATGKFLGSAFAWLYGTPRRARVNEPARREWYVPTNLKDVDRRRIRYVTRLDEADRVYRFDPEFYSTVRRQWEPIDFNKNPMVQRVYANQESRLGYGRGIMDSIYVTTYSFEKVEKYGLQGLQRWAQGMLVGKLAAQAQGDTTKGNTERRNDFKDVLLEHIGDNVLIIDDRDNVEVIEPSGQGHQMVDAWLGRLERNLVTRIEGTPITIMDGEGGGSRALGAEHGSREHAQQTFDREDLAEDIDQVVRMVYERNVPTLREVNPALLDVRLPKFAIRHSKDEDPKQVAEMFEVVLRNGVTVSEREYRERVGIRTPEKDEPVIAGRQDFGMPGPGGGFGGFGPDFSLGRPQPTEAPE